MSLFSELATKMTIDNKQFLAGLSQAERQVDKLTLTTKRMGATLAPALGGLATLGVTVLATGLTKTISKMDDLVDTADNLKIGVTQFQELGYAAEQNGSSVEALTGLLTKMQKTIGDAESGNKKAIESFNRIGLSVKDLIGLSPDEQFKKIAQSLSSISDKNEQASATFGMLGKQGAGALSLINTNLDESIRKAHDMGQILDDDVARSVASLADRGAELAKTWTVAFAKIADVSAPALNFLINRLGEVADLLATIGKIVPNTFGLIKDKLGIGAYDPNADGKPRNRSNYSPTNYSNFDYGGANKDAQLNKLAMAGFETSDKDKFNIIIDSLSKRDDVYKTSFDKLGSAVDKAKNSVQEFAARMDTLKDLLTGKFADNSLAQADNTDFNATARSLIEAKLKGGSDEYIQSRFRELQSDISAATYGVDENTGEIKEFSTANMQKDLEDLKKLIMGDKGENSVEVTIKASPEFDATITKKLINGIPSFFRKEAIANNR